MMLKLVKLKRSNFNMIYNDKHVTTKELKRLSAKNFTARSKQANLATKTFLQIRKILIKKTNKFR